MYDACKKHADLWSTKTMDEIRTSDLIKEKLTSVQKIEFLSQLLDKSTITDLNEDKINSLSSTYEFGRNQTKNSEIRFRFMRLIIKARLINKFDEIFEFANSNFRMKFVRPVYKDLGQWNIGKPLAIANFDKVKNEMMKVCAYTVAKDLGINM